MTTLHAFDLIGDRDLEDDELLPDEEDDEEDDDDEADEDLDVREDRELVERRRRGGLSRERSAAVAVAPPEAPGCFEVASPRPELVPDWRLDAKGLRDLLSRRGGPRVNIRYI